MNAFYGLLRFWTKFSHVSLQIDKGTSKPTASPHEPDDGSMPVHVLRSIFCDFRRAIGINMNVDDGRALFVAGETSTLIVLHRDDAVPFLADIPLSGIESVALGLIDEIGQNGTIISFKKEASDTIFLDGEGHHTDRMKIAVIGKAEELSQSIMQAKNASQRTAMASEALSPINVSVAQRRAVMIDRYGHSFPILWRKC